MAQEILWLQAYGTRVGFRPGGGCLTGLVVTDQGLDCVPYHRANWVGPVPVAAPPHHHWLQGDFFCAPFGDAPADAAPLHGWPANGLWQVETFGTGQLRAVMPRAVMGARLVKELTVRDGLPFVHQRHVFSGGQGRIAAANHAMIALAHGGRITMSPKAAFRTMGHAPEPDPARGRSALRYPATAGDARSFPGANGGLVDLTRYPIGPAHEDFVVALEPVGGHLGWTAVVRPSERDCYLSLRRADAAPATMLWFSNGGRDYPPWSGGHLGCLGVEEGFHGPILGADDPDRRDLVLEPHGTVEMRHVTGAICWPSGQPVRSVVAEGATLLVLGEDGAERRVGFDPDFLGLGGANAGA